MGHRSRIIFLAAIAAAVFLNSCYSYAQDIGVKSVAKFTALEGDIRYKANNSEIFKPVSRDEAMNLDIFPEDTIISNTDTSGEITTIYGAKISIVAGTEIQVQNYGLRINKGGIWVSYKPVPNKSGYVFKTITPSGTIGIKGTKFAVLIDGANNKTMVQVREGIIEFKNGAGETRDVAAGEALEILENGPFGTPVKYDKTKDILAPSEYQEKSGRTENSKKAGPKGLSGEGTAETDVFDPAALKTAYGKVPNGETLEQFITRNEEKLKINSAGEIKKAYMIYMACGGEISKFISFQDYKKQTGINDIREYNRALETYLTNSYKHLIK